MLRKILLPAALGACITGMAWAGDDDEAKTLTIGDKAPSIDIAHWVIGEIDAENHQVKSITEFENGQVYVLEFWATWCGPCRASMPHLTELQKKYADYDVQMIGISDEPLPTVVKFLAKHDKKSDKLWYDKIGYTLTTDPDESVKGDYFKAAGQRGIPTAFIVGKDGHVEWIGHPMKMDDPLDAVVRDSWDRGEFKAKWEKEQSFERDMAKAEQKYMEAMQAGDWETVNSLLGDMIEKYPDNDNLLMQQFNLMLTKLDQPDAAYEVGHKLLKSNWDNAQMLNALAWTVVDDANVTKRDFDFAMKAAKRANELTDSKDAAIIDTLARVYYESGDLKKAIEWQRKAVEHSGDDMMGDQIREMLERYIKESEDI